MFEAKRQRSTLRLLFNLAELTFHSSVRKVRQTHRNALMSIALNVLQTALFLAAFYLLFTVLGTRGMAIRGDFLLYLLSGIFLYLTHIKALSAVMGSEGAASPMMLHGQMNTIVAILSSGLSNLYLQTLTLFIMLFGIHVLVNPLEIQHWELAFMMFLLAWFSGCAIGIVFMALQPWLPDLISILKTVYVRANMIASGKMFVANMLPSMMVAMFDWNPLFHIIDQSRGFVFINYNPHFTNWEYPLYFSLGILILGLMGEFYTRKHVSASWGAGR